jgi:hypothetical protein
MKPVPLAQAQKQPTSTFSSLLEEPTAIDAQEFLRE